MNASGAGLVRGGILLLVWLAGCRPVTTTPQRVVSAERVQPQSFDDMALETVRRNLRQVESTMTPDDVVTVLGLQAMGTLEQTKRDDRVEYQFAGQQCRLVVRTTNSDPGLDPSWLRGGMIAGPGGIGPFFDNATWIAEIACERSDGTSVVFSPSDWE